MRRGERNGSSSLARYNEMRDFDVTAEPSGELHRSESGRSFVIQKHDATRLHYDFRLEHEGVLWSWAVPKGPSLDPRERRLAVQTEDHPVDYRDFEGTIPHGEYGGGPVIVWDKGTWEPVGDPAEGMRKGRIEFVVHGQKLHGRFLLVKTKEDERGKKQWLLIKRNDEHVRHGAEAVIVDRMPGSVLTGRTIEDIVAGVPARPRAKTKRKARGSKVTPRGVKLPPFGKAKPQLATLVDDVPTDGRWVYELKYDGYRAIATLDHGKVRIASRNGKDWTDHFPYVAEALSHVRAETAVFDGEIAYVMEDGRTDFQRLQNAIGASGKDAARVVYFVFDLLHYDGVDMTKEPLLARKERLRTILAGEGPPLRMGDHVTANGEAFFEQACKLGLEGIIAKRADRPYVEGRGPDWVKVKCQKRQELVIVGFTPPKGKRASTGIGALLLAVRENDAFRYVGKVGTGFSNASLKELHQKLSKIPAKGNAPSAAGAPRLRDATWVEPRLVCQVRFTEWTSGGALRHPTFEGLREDKKAESVVRETETSVDRVEAHAKGRTTAAKAAKARPAKAKARPAKAKAKPTKAAARTTTTTKASADGKIVIGGVTVSHPSRVVDPSIGLTKEDLVRYAEATAEHALAFAKKRPLMLLRCTDAWTTRESFGSQGRRPVKGAPCFVQKHSGRGLLENIGRETVEGEEVLFVTKPKDLVVLAQNNTVELHGWGSRLPKWDKPDWIVFDLDPDVGLPFARVVDAAIEMKEELAKMGLTTFVKTTGGKGLHVVVPLTPRDDWEVVSAFASAVSHGMVKRAPSAYVATMTKAARKGKIFVDHFRNAQGATAILPYSARARAGTPVALPVAWKDLPHVAPQELTVRTVPALLAKRRTDPWAELLETEQTLPRDLVRALRGGRA